MGLAMPHAIILGATGAVSLALLFQIIGVATPEWVSASEESLGLAVNGGLWKACTDSICVEISGNLVPDWLKAVRAFGLIGVIVMAMSAGGGILSCFLSNLQQVLSLAANIAAFLGAVCSLIEWAIYLGEANTTVLEHLGYSFALTVTATILCLVATAIFLWGRRAMRVS